MGIIHLLFLKHALFEEKGSGKSRILIFISHHQYSISNCHTRDNRAITASNEIPDRLDTLTSIVSNHGLVVHTYISPREFWEWFDDKLVKLDVKLDVKSFSVQILIVLNPRA